MSIHYSVYDLNTFYVMPYFQAHLPPDYPYQRVIESCRAFRRLPPNLKILAELTKKWVQRKYPELVDRVNQFYDEDGYELSIEDRHQLSDEEIDAMWEGVGQEDKDLDIQIPPSGFADPDKWEEPLRFLEEEPYEYEGPTEESIRRDIKTMGAQFTADHYGYPANMAAGMAPEALAAAIYDARGGPR